MSDSDFFLSVCMLLGVTSAISASSFPYVENGIQYSLIPQFTYISTKPSAAFSGYSYATQDFNGASSNVIFTSGPDSKENFRMGLESMNRMANMPEKQLQMDMQNAPEKSDKSSETFDMLKNMESGMKDSLEPQEQMNKLNEVKEMDKVVKQGQPMHQPLPVLQNPIFHQNSEYLGFPSVFPKIYVLPNELATPHYSANSYLQPQIPAYGYTNPQIRILYQTPFVSPENTFQEHNKLFYNFVNHNERIPRANCTNSNPPDVSPANSKTTPASEYVTNPMKNMLLNETSSSTLNETKSSNQTVELKDSMDQLTLNTSNNTDIKGENVTEMITVKTNASSTTITNEM